MATYVNDLRLKEIATGDESGTWGTSTNTNLELIAEGFSYATVDPFDTDADKTETMADGATDPIRSLYLKVTSTATLTATRTLTLAPDTVSKVWIIENATTGGQSISISQGSGSNVTIPNGDVKAIYTDGAGATAAVTDAFANLKVTDAAQTNITSVGTLTSLTVSGDLTVDTSTLYVDSTNNRVGIGTSSPLLPLHAVTTGTGTSMGDNASATFRSGAAGRASTIQLSDGTSSNYISSLSGALGFGYGSTETVRIDTSGNVGIGVTPSSSTYKNLQINTTGIIGSNAGYVWFGNNWVYDSGDKYIANGYATLYGSNEGKHTWFVAPSGTAGNAISFSQAMTIDNSGNVGIGTSSPASGVGSPLTLTSTSTGYVGLRLNGTGSYTNDWDLYASGDGAGLDFFGIYDRTGVAYRMVVTNTGNVGIGTTSPVANLHISGAANNTYLRIDDGTEFLNLGVDSTGIFYNSNTTHRFLTNGGGTECLRILSDGKVGIGTSSPQNKLHISGNLTIDNSSNAPYIDFVENADTTDSKARITMDQVDGSNGQLLFYTEGSGTLTERMRITATGTVGIKSSSPDYTLSVAGVIEAEPATELAGANAGANFLHYSTNNYSYFNGAYGANGVFFGEATGATRVGMQSSQTMTFETNGSESMRLTSNGEFLLNRSSIFGSGNTCSAFIEGKSTAAMYVIGTNTSGYQLITFFNGGLNVMGSITHNNTSVTYGTSSDYRLKENVVELDGAIDRVKLLQPKRFNFIADAENTVDGFLAHEVADVVPEAITGVKDEMQEEEYEVTPAVLDEDGKVVTEAVMGTREVPKYQNIDQSKLVPLLTKAIQELSNKVDNQQVLIEQLQAEVALLKGE